MNILLSIKPKYSEKIFSGEKKYEFRKKTPKGMVEKVFIYESTPSKYIVGWFTIKNVLTGTPERIWDMCKNHGGIDQENFFTYCEDIELIHALEIDNYYKYDSPINPYEMITDFKPPQNFSYLENPILCSKLKD